MFPKHENLLTEIATKDISNCSISNEKCVSEKENNWVPDI